MTVRAGVVDLGSSSFHLLVCDAAADGMLVTVAKSRATLDLGAGVGASGSISADRVSAGVAACRQMARRLGDLAPDVVVAVGTAALRDAANGDEVAAKLADALGVPIQVLDGPTEARLCITGQRAAVWTGEGPTVGIDLGGGSSELAVAGVAGLVVTASVPVGATRLRGEFGGADPLGESGRRLVADRVDREVAGWSVLLGEAGIAAARVVASGGTVRALARTAVARTRWPVGSAQVSVNQVELPAAQLDVMADRLCRLTVAERVAIPGMPSRRARSIAYGAAALHALVVELGADHLVVSEWGLREGAILEALAFDGPVRMEPAANVERPREEQPRACAK